MKNNRCIKKKGFTLTEVLVVVLIIGVLAAVVYPMYTKAITKSRAVEAIGLLEMVRNKQMQSFARTGEYYKEFKGMGQITSDSSAEDVSKGSQLIIKDYTLSLNNATNCMSAKYQKGSNSFTFSTSYENAGLGCTGSICQSFGGIIGDSQSVCNCGSKTCSGGFTLDADTCECVCFMSCKDGSSCHEPYGGGQTMPCENGCGSYPSTSSCNGPVWNTSACGSLTQTQPTSQGCGNGGTQTRECSSSCSGGTCKDWSACTGQDCNKDKKPAEEQTCGKCGTKTQTLSCDDTTATWIASGFGVCTNEGVCTPGATQACGNEGTQTCTNSCGWGSCTGEKKECTGSVSQACGNCGTQTRSCDTATGTWSDWGTCTGEKECAPKTEETKACEGFAGDQKRTCSDSCSWGAWDATACGCGEGQCLYASGKCYPQSSGKQYDGKCYYDCADWQCNNGTGWNCTDKNFKAYHDCNPGETETELCEDGKNNKTRTCSDRCGWGAWDDKQCEKVCASDTCKVGNTCQKKPSGLQYDGKCYYTCEQWQCNEGKGWICAKKKSKGTQGGSYTRYTEIGGERRQPSEGACMTYNCSEKNTTIGKAIIAANGNFDAKELCVQYCKGASGTPAGTVICDTVYKWHYYDFYNSCPQMSNTQYECTIYKLTCFEEKSNCVS